MHVRDVAAAADYGGWVVGGEGEEAMDAREASQRSIRSCSTLLVDVMLAVTRREASVLPRLSAAMTTPSANLIPMTEVPVTAGC